MSKRKFYITLQTIYEEHIAVLASYKSMENYWNPSFQHFILVILCQVKTIELIIPYLMYYMLARAE